MTEISGRSHPGCQAYAQGLQRGSQWSSILGSTHAVNSERYHTCQMFPRCVPTWVAAVTALMEGSLAPQCIERTCRVHADPFACKINYNLCCPRAPSPISPSGEGMEGGRVTKIAICGQSGATCCMGRVFARSPVPTKRQETTIAPHRHATLSPGKPPRAL